jgi:hypothetical protein
VIKPAIESVTVPQPGLWMCSEARLARVLRATLVGRGLQASQDEMLNPADTTADPI